MIKEKIEIEIAIDPSGTGTTGMCVKRQDWPLAIESFKGASAMEHFKQLRATLLTLSEHYTFKIYCESILPNGFNSATKDLVELAKLVGMIEALVFEFHCTITWIRAKDTKAMSKPIWMNKDFEKRVDRKKVVVYEGIEFKSMHELDSYCILKIGREK